MGFLKTDLKKVFYISIAALVLFIILANFVFFMSVENNIIKRYLPDTKSDTISGSKSKALKDLFYSTMILVLMSIVIFCLSFVFSLFTYKFFINGPFSKLRTGLKSVREGDFETRILPKGLTECALLYEDFNNTVKAVQKKIAIKHYVSNSTEKMVEILNAGDVTTQPRKKLVTVFFSDIRGFTAFSEQHDALVVINRINELFNIQVGIIRKNSGDIDKFIGDAILVEFPSPALAFKSAIEIQKKIQAYNERIKMPLSVGIGISHGEVLVGPIGAGDQFNWTMIGRVVNLASRLCCAAKPGSILVASEVHEKLNTKFSFDKTDLKLKGYKGRVTAYEFSDFS
jgi:class 3 adenylate cyclase